MVVTNTRHSHIVGKQRVPSSLITIISQYSAWHKWPTAAKLAICGAVSPLVKREKSSCTVLNMYSRSMKSNLLLTSRNGRRTFLSARDRCTVDSRMALNSSGGRASMTGEEDDAQGERKDWIYVQCTRQTRNSTDILTAMYCTVFSTANAHL